MFPKHHIIISFILSIILFPFIGFYTILVFLAGILIDADHYLYYIVSKKEISFRKAYIYCRDAEFHDILHILHVFEFYILIAVLSFFSDFFLYIYLGLVFHLMLDLIYDSTLKVKRRRRE